MDVDELSLQGARPNQAGPFSNFISISLEMECVSLDPLGQSHPRRPWKFVLLLHMSWLIQVEALSQNKCSHFLKLSNQQLESNFCFDVPVGNSLRDLIATALLIKLNSPTPLVKSLWNLLGTPSFIHLSGLQGTFTQKKH